MAGFLKIVIDEKGAEMSADERSLISVAFKNIVSAKRTTWRTVVSVQGNPKYLIFQDALTEYKTKLEDQLFADCNGIINNIRNNILKKRTIKGEEEKKTGTNLIRANEARAFFLKMIADNFRYIAEMSITARKT